MRWLIASPSPVAAGRFHRKRACSRGDQVGRRHRFCRDAELPRVVEKLRHDAVEPIGFIHDHPYHLGVGARAGRFEKLRRATDAAQWVLDLVRQIANQLLVGLGLLGQALLAVLLDLLLKRQQLDNRLACCIGLRHHHMHRHRFAVQRPEPGVVTQRRKLVAASALQRVLQYVRLGKAVRQLGTFDGAAGGTQRVFEGSVGEHDHSIRTYHSHQCGQQVKRLEARGAGSRYGGKKIRLFQVFDFGAFWRRA